MISKRFRFHGLNSLRFVFKRGRTVRGAHTSLKYEPNPRREDYRLSVVVSKKVHKSAVVRNRIRRRLYEQVRLRQSLIREPYDLVLSVYSDQVADMPAQQLSAEIDELLKKAHLV